MNNNYLADQHKNIKDRHYILKANLPNFFFNFRPTVLKKYTEKHGEDFMLIIWKDQKNLDAFFIPYSEAKKVFRNEALTCQANSNSLRWLGTITDQVLSLGANAKLDVAKFHNTMPSYEALT